MKRIVTLLAATALVAAMLFVVVPLAGARTTATTVNVTAKEYSFKLSRKSAPHGKVTFKVVNKGKFSHDFKIAGKKTKLLKKNQSATLTVTLKKGKSYPYICTVPGHAQLGMKGTFKAT
jgi:uncharacterized cupredoxin-like copper-binding protein